MKKNENEHMKMVISIGMFDIFKGMGTLLIIFGHTFSSLNIAASGGWISSILQLLMLLLVVGLMPAFFIVSGYGFRKRPVGKCIKQQSSLLLKPYLVVSVSTVLGHFVVHYACFRYFPASVKETLKVAGGFLLALPQNKEVLGITVFGCGAMWYIVALMIGWVLLDILMTYVPEKYVIEAVVISMTLGWLIGNGKVLPFCISQGLIAVGFLYIGYQIKKAKLLERGFPWYAKLVMILSCVLSLVSMVWFGNVDSMDGGVWVAGPVSMLIDAAIGTGILILVLKLNQLDHPILHFIQKIGRESLVIFCAHTAEMIAIPWYLINERLIKSPFGGNMLVFLLRCCIIAVGVFLVTHKREITEKMHIGKQERNNG